MPKQTPHVKRAIALTAAFALTVSGITVHKGENAQAASKAPTLSASSVTLKKGQTKKIKINANKQKIKKVTWKVDKKKLKITKKTKKYVVVKALKTGSASISVTIKTTKKTYTRTVKTKIKTTKKTTPKPKPTKKPVNSPAPSTPAVSGEPSGSGAPTVTTPSDKTAGPADTNTPDESKAPDETKAPDESAEPAVSDAPSESSQPSTSQAPSKPDNPVINRPVPEYAAQKLWGSAYKLADVSADNKGAKYKYSVMVKLSGDADVLANNPSFTKLKIVSNYNTSYPMLASVDVSDAYADWTLMTFEHRFADITSANACLYFDGIPDGMSVWYKEFTEVLIEPDDGLGGTPIAKNEWNMITVTDLQNGTTNPHKYYENKQVRISFDIREKGVADPTGTTVNLQANPGNEYPVLKSGIELTTGWTNVTCDYTFGEITNTHPSLYFNYTDALADMELYIRNVNIEILGDAPAPPEPSAGAPSPAPSAGAASPGAIENLVLTGDDLGASADFTYEANGAAQYTTVSQPNLSGDKFTSDPTLALEWEAKDKDGNDITATTKFNITIRKDNPNWQQGNANDVAVAYEKTSSHSMQLGTDKVSDLTSDNTIYIIIATSVAGFNGTFTLKKLALNGTEETSLPASYTYVENGMAQWAPTAQVSLPADIDFSKYKSCEIEYTVDDVGSTGVGLQAIVGAKDNTNADKSIPNYTEDRASGKFVINLTDTLKTLTGFTNPYIKLQTATAGFKGSVTITKVTFVLND